MPYRNPTPVAVALVAVGQGLLGIRRGEAPAKGELALPGGFVEMHETFCMAAARELKEEVGLDFSPSTFRVFREGISDDGTKLLVFCLQHETLKELPAFTPNPEASEVVVLTKDAKLGFPLHQAVLTELSEFIAVYGGAVVQANRQWM